MHSQPNSPLLVIDEEIDNDILAALVINTIPGTFKTCAVKAPGFGDRRQAMVQDMATLTGANMVSDDLGLTLGNVKMFDLGRTRRIKVG